MSVKVLMDRMDEVSRGGLDDPRMILQGEHRHWSARWRPWESWTVFRSRSTAMGCVSSAMVLIVRLYLDTQPLAYLIHSIIVFLDMVLIHLFTNSIWLSISGEIVTILHFVAFHYTKETIFELLETTIIAILCSFHLIVARNKHMQGEIDLKHKVQDIKYTSMQLLRTHSRQDFDWDEVATELQQIPEDIVAEQQQQRQEAITTMEEGRKKITNRQTSSSSSGTPWLLPKTVIDPNTDTKHQEEEERKTVGGKCGEQFFEHFLDGSAGVMYTSFLGLIITELISYGEAKTKYS